MSEITPIEQSPGVNVEVNDDIKLLGRVDRWVNERPRLMWGERNARRQIAREIQKDIRGLQNPLTPESVAQRAKKFGEKPIMVQLKDSQTKEDFYQVLRMESGDLIAEERRTEDWSSDTNLISQARLGPQGQTELTLSFTGERFQERDANPNILHSNRFPNATVKVFDTLVGSVEQTLKKQSTSTKPPLGT